METNYNFEPLTEYLKSSANPKELASILREIQLRYTLALLDIATRDPEGDHPMLIKNTMEDIYHLKNLADCFEKVTTV